MPDDLPVPDFVLLYAFRYALGRRDAVYVAGQVERHASVLEPWMRDQMDRDITRALLGRGVWPSDVADRWRLCRDRLAAHDEAEGVSR